MNRERENSSWKTAIPDYDELKMVWNANQPIISAREKCLKSQVIAHCRVYGRVYGSLIISQKSREHYNIVVGLELAMRPSKLVERSLGWIKEISGREGEDH